VGGRTRKTREGPDLGVQSRGQARAGRPRLPHWKEVRKSPRYFDLSSRQGRNTKEKKLQSCAFHKTKGGSFSENQEKRKRCSQSELLSDRLMKVRLNISENGRKNPTLLKHVVSEGEGTFPTRLFGEVTARIQGIKRERQG